LPVNGRGMKPIIVHELLLGSFQQYLRHTRGLAEGTCHYHVRFLREFLHAAFPQNSICWARLQPSLLVDYVIEQSQRLHPSTVQSLASALRNFLRFSAMKGWSSPALVQGVPKVKGASPALPRYLSVSQLHRLLAQLRRQPRVGLRNFALGLCLAQLGLRAGEARRLTLDDIDWRQGVIRLPRTKNLRAYQLPLPRQTGQAIADYLRHARPSTSLREVFLTDSQPVRALTTGAISNLIATAMIRADIDLYPKGAHVLRHTLASHLIQKGANLKEVADLLRHRQITTTTIYAKVNLTQLAALARPWPEVRA
jgi:integrase/recombinase XerD